MHRFALLSVLFLPLFAFAQTGTPCNQFQSGSAPPAGYGAAWNVLSSAKELLLDSKCDANGISLTVGSNTNQYAYKVGYRYNASQAQWLPITLQGTFHSGSTDWLQGRANYTASVPSADIFWVGYICHWMGETTGWKCGCRDSTCATNFWQLQQVIYPRGGTTGGSTGGATFDDSKYSNLCFASSGGGAGPQVASASALSSALANAQAGTRIIVAGGTYAGNFTLSKSGTAASPIIVQAAPGARPVFTGTFTLSGNFGVISGMQFNGGNVTITGDSNRVTRNQFLNMKVSGVWIKSGSGADRNRIDHNDLSKPVRGIQSQGIHLAVAESGSGIRMPEYTRIDHNYFHDASGSYENGHEAIAVGTGGGMFYRSYTLIDRNFFTAWDIDGETVGLKSSSAFVRENTLINSDSYLSSRNGTDHEYWNNHIENAIGIVLHGDRHKVIGNRVVAADIRVTAGENVQPANPSRTQKADVLAAHSASTDALVSGNSGSSGAKIVVGHAPAAPWCCAVLAQRTMLEPNTGFTIVRDKETGTITRAASVTPGSPKKLTAAEVGLAAPDPYCP